MMENETINTGTNFLKQSTIKIAVKNEHDQQRSKPPEEDEVDEHIALQIMRSHKFIAVSAPFIEGNYELAVRKINSISNRYHGNEEVPYFGPTDQLRAYGPGIYLFFKYLRYLSMLFGIVTILSFCPIIYNAMAGNNYTNVAFSLKTALGYTTIGNLKGSDVSYKKLMNSIPDVVISVIVFVFCFFWDSKSAELLGIVNKKVKLPSYLTVVIQNFPEGTEQAQIQNVMQRYGQISEICSVKSYQECLFIAKKIHAVQMDKQTAKARVKSSIGDQQFLARLEKRDLDAELIDLNRQLSEETVKLNPQPLKMYVVFRQATSRQEAIKQYAYYQDKSCCFKEELPENMRLNSGGSFIVHPCQAQPTGILWENVHIRWRSRWIRALLQILLLLILIFFSFVILSMLNVATPPSSQVKVDLTNLNQNNILFVTNSVTVEAWCNQNTVIALKRSDLTTLCAPHYERRGLRLGLTILISCGTIIVKSLLRMLVVFLARFQRYKSYAELAADTTRNLFLTYSATIVLLPLLLQAKFNNVEMKNLILYFLKSQSVQQNVKNISSYSDFVDGWYLDIGYQLILTWLIMAFSPHLFMPIYYYIMECYSHSKARKALTQLEMEMLMEPQQFDVEDHYANIMLISIFGLIFSAGIPLLLPLTFIAIWTRYIYFRFIFVRFSRIPKAFDHSINEMVLRYTVIGLIIHLFISVWMLGERQIFFGSAQDKSQFIIKQAWSRLLDTWYVSGLLVIVIAVFFLRQTIVNFFIALICPRGKIERAPTAMVRKANPHQSMMLSQRAMTHSYNIKANPEYSAVVGIIEKAVLEKQQRSPNASAHMFNIGQDERNNFQ